MKLFEAPTPDIIDDRVVHQLYMPGPGIHRDMRERGRTRESVIAQFDATAKPMADLYVVPSQQRATLTVSGTDALDWSIEQILRSLRSQNLL